MGVSTVPALDRAYALISVKSIDDEQRIVEGFASTPTPDRGGDVMEPSGAEFSLPHPLLWQHKHEQPIGHVLDAKVTSKGIWIKAQIARGVLPRIDDIWAMVKSGLVGGFSIGWQPSEANRTKEGGLHVKRWRWLETSVVTVPMNAETTIALIKSIDEAHLAVSGTEVAVAPVKSAGVSAPVVRSAQKGARAMNYPERIKSLETSIGVKTAELEAIQTKVNDENRTKDAAEREQFDTLKDEISSLMSELADTKSLEQINRDAAKPVPAVKGVEGSTVPARSYSSPIVTLKPELAKGTLFTRYAMAVAAGKGSISDTIAYAKRWDDQTPEVSAYIKAVQGTSTGGSPAWGAELVYQQNIASEFVELLMPATIVGKLNGIRKAPFNTRMAVHDVGATVNWVGEGLVKPVSDLSFAELTLGNFKIAGIVVLTEELIRLSTPNAEEVVRRDLKDQIVAFMDRQFVDPTITATSSRPASITNGVASPAASGTDADALYADLNTALATFDDAETGTENVYILMRPAVARGISALRNALGQFEFPGLMVNGGTLMGFPVIVSSSVPAATIVVVKADEILLADDGQVTLDASNQATLDMAGGTTPTFNLWQRNCVGIRAERWVAWTKRRSAAVAVIDTVAYAPS